MTQVEPIVWLYSTGVQVETEWDDFDLIIPLQADVELVSVDVKLVNEAQYGSFFGGLEVLKDLSNDKAMAGNTTTHMFEAGQLSEGLLVYGSVETSAILNAYFVFNETFVASTPGSTVLTLSSGDTVLSTLTIQEDIEAGVVTSFGPLAEHVLEMLTSVRITSSGEAPSGLLILRWDIK